ncbi:MAG TPA: deoxyguanosinetriphosphate triphosphohydrolase, partial [Burkholderiales bacterium]|nr:deoxyguanosinetriphosphate triphosphohydrolase [Burkholderiales bacterium]
LVSDLTTQSLKNIRHEAPVNLDEVRKTGSLIAFSLEIREEQQQLKQFLRRHLYQHYRVARMSGKARRIIADLFRAFMEDARLLPPQFQDKAGGDKPRAIADYIAGMTDRYAIREHRRLFSVEELWS